MDKLKERLLRDMDDLKALADRAGELEQEWRSLDKQASILSQKITALAKEKLEFKKDKEHLELQRQGVADKQQKTETQMAIVDKQKEDFRKKMNEMRTLQVSIDKRLEEGKKLDEREKEINEQEVEIAKKGTEVARREAIVAKEKKLIRERKIQLEGLLASPDPSNVSLFQLA